MQRIHYLGNVQVCAENGFFHLPGPGPAPVLVRVDVGIMHKEQVEVFVLQNMQSAGMRKAIQLRLLYTLQQMTVSACHLDGKTLGGMGQRHHGLILPASVRPDLGHIPADACTGIDRPEDCAGLFFCAAGRLKQRVSLYVPAVPVPVRPNFPRLQFGIVDNTVRGRLSACHQSSVRRVG